MTYKAERVFSENETCKEYGNRVYIGIEGYVWLVRKDGDLLDDKFKTFKELKRKYPSAEKIKATR